MLEGAVSCDVDTLASIYKGYGLRRPGGYTYAEFRMGLENFCRFLAPLGIRATLFVVGTDLQQPQNVPSLVGAMAEGHEVANHTLSHMQGFRLMSPEAKEREISGMEELCAQATGKRPVGFRAPGWNISDDALPILRRRGYLYDSSVFPSSMNPLLKWLHRHLMRRRPAADRTTLGAWQYMFAPPVPYQVGGSFARRGSGLVELPVTVTPLFRLPFFATMLVATGLEVFRGMLALLKLWGRPIQFQFHLSDFVDYSHPDLAGQVPARGGVYIPQALQMPLDRKWTIFRSAVDLLARDYAFLTLEQWARARVAR